MTAEPDDATLREILAGTRTIAVVGASPDWERPSCYTMQYMQSMGYRIIPVNPVIAGDQIFGRPVLAALTEIDGPIDIVNIFRKPEAAAEVVAEAIAVGARTVWMQEGVTHAAAEELARRAGLQVVTNLCIKKEHFRLFGGAARAAETAAVQS